MHRTRLAAQLLDATEQLRDPVAVVQRLLAVQAQDHRSFPLALRARTVGVGAADVERALSEERSLVVSWLNRGTLHLIASQDFPWLQALIGPGLRRTATYRLARLGLPADAADRAVRAVERILAAEGPLPREQLRERLSTAAGGIPGKLLVHVLFLAATHGLVVRGPVVDGKRAFVLTRDWLPAASGVDREVALRELAARYLRSHGPASAQDLAQWSGLSLGAARTGLAAQQHRIREVAPGLVDLATGAPAESFIPTRLLGGFDPLLFGWASREAVLDGHADLVTSNGIYRPVLLIDGRAAGTWRLNAHRVLVQPFLDLPLRVQADVDAEAHDVERFLQKPADRPPCRAGG